MKKKLPKEFKDDMHDLADYTYKGDKTLANMIIKEWEKKIVDMKEGLEIMKKQLKEFKP